MVQESNLEVCGVKTDNLKLPLERHQILHFLRGMQEKCHQFNTWEQSAFWKIMHGQGATGLNDPDGPLKMSAFEADQCCNRTAPFYILRDNRRSRWEELSEPFLTLLHTYIYRRWFRPYRSEIDYGQFLAKFIVNKPITLPDQACLPSKETVDLVIRYNARLCARIIDAQESTKALKKFDEEEQYSHLYGTASHFIDRSTAAIIRDQDFFILQPLFRAIAIAIQEPDFRFDDQEFGSVSVTIIRTGVEDDLSAPINFNTISDDSIKGKLFGPEGTVSAVQTDLDTAVTFLMVLDQREVTAFGARPDPAESMKDLDSGSLAPVQERVASSSSAVSLPIRNTHELFHDSARNCIHLAFDLSEVPGMSYKTDNHLAVWPVNLDDEVERLLCLLGLTNSRSVPLSIKSLDTTIKVPILKPTTPEVLFRHYLEVCAAVSRATIEALVQFAPSHSAKTFLEVLVKDKAKHAAFSQKHYLALGRLLELSVQSQGLQEDGAWKTIPLAFVVETLSALHPRLYSIPSSSVISPKVASVTALVVKTALPGTLNESIHGVASNYLHSASLLANSQAPASQLSHYIPRDSDPRLHVAVRKSAFRPQKL
ncbi:hypothetical protein B0J13DRAFT_628784 [Dactylonectria estremocensis]|uniref:FAD-binding FR-type domain-containing protein n=1 Tax=Dactylonectria estremocensis TaxID=1079267 RepID=A0A9P9DP83_9HYPO|nr:hypothetical protein B0J13DRAFT_628784 [Dactylonectria estremocensis]